MLQRGIVGLALAAALAASSGHAIAAPPVVRDASGAPVGTVLGEAADAVASYEVDAGSLVWVASPVPGATVRLLLGEQAVWDTKDLAPLLYESADCTGTPLVDAAAQADAIRTAVVFSTDLFWAEGAGARRVVRSSATLVRDPGDCADVLVAEQVCCRGLARGETRLVAPVTGASLVSLGLQPPFRIDAGRTAD